MIAYLDTSVALRILLRQQGALRRWTSWTALYTSEMFRVETRRVLDRLRLEAHLDDEGVATAREELVRIEATLHLVGLTPNVLERAAAPFPTVVKTLDALHLATALLIRERGDEEVEFATHDAQQAVAARALGFRMVG